MIHWCKNTTMKNGDKHCKHKRLKLIAQLPLEEWSEKKKLGPSG